MFLVFVLLSYSASSDKSLVAQDSKNISDTSDLSHSAQGDPSGYPNKYPKSNKPNKSDENSERYSYLVNIVFNNDAIVKFIM